MGSTTRAGRTGVERRTSLRHHPLALACATALLLATGSAQAQDPPKTDTPEAAGTQSAKKEEPKELKSVKVVGIRRGIEDAIDTKKDNTSIVESISAEDIGKLPDVSIAESIARLPGLTAQRVAGRAQVISVRGLSPDFSTSLLNGRELVSTGDNRSVEYDQYPSELMAGVTVYKTPDATLVGQGLSGTVNMKTVRPLDFADSVVAVSGRLTHNSLGSAADSDANGNRFNVSWITQNADRTVGFAVGYSHSDTPVQENQVGLYEPWRRLGPGWRPGVPSGAGCPEAPSGCTYYSDGIKALRRTGDTRRDALMATLQFRPGDNWESTFDVFHSEATQKDTARQFEVHLGGYNGGYPPGLFVEDPEINSDGTFVGGTATGVYPLVRGMYNKREDEINAVGWNNKWNWGQVAMTADLSWSHSTRDETLLENNLQRFPAPQLDSVTVDYDTGDFPQIDPGLDYSDPTQLLVTNTIYGSGYGKTPSVEDELWSIKLAGNLPSGSNDGWFSSYDFGINYDDRTKEKHQPENNIVLGAQGPVVVPSDLQHGLVSLNFAGVGWIPSWDVAEVVDRFMVFNPTDDLNYLVAKTWSVDEKITSAWFQANIDTEWGSVPVRGNIGLQAQHVSQSSDSFYWDSTQPSGQNRLPVHGGTSYTDWLPSLNLSFAYSNDVYLRVAAARQVARPRMDQLRSSLEFNLSNVFPYDPSGSGGNPELDPWRANAFDISLEKYFEGTKGYVAAAFFYKDLRTYIFTQSRDYDFSDFIENSDAINKPADPVGSFTAPYNGKGGSMQGLELTASIPFELFSESMRGFGIIANASFNNSSIEIFADPSSFDSVGTAEIDLPGLSKRIYNFTAYYERNGFEARINNRRRSDFIGEISNFDAARTLRYVEGENITDAQLSYQFPEGSTFEGLGLLLQGQNLTNEHYRTYANTKDRPLENIEWGRTILFGATYKF